MSIYSKGEITSEQISICPTSPWTVCQAESTLQETIKASNEDLTHKAALMYKSTLQVVIVVNSQWPACEMQSQVVYTCSAGLRAVKVRYLELVVTWTLAEFRKMQLKRRECFSASQVSYSNKDKRKQKVCVGYTGLSLSFFLLSPVPEPTGIVRCLILVSDSRCIFHSSSKQNEII